jgi:hypothetical protein
MTSRLAILGSITPSIRVRQNEDNEALNTSDEITSIAMARRNCDARNLGAVSGANCTLVDHHLYNSVIFVTTEQRGLASLWKNRALRT